VLEIQPEFLMIAKLAGSRSVTLRKMGVAGLDAGMVDSSPTRSNIVNPKQLGQRVRAVSHPLGRGGQLGLLLPDGVVRISILTFETLPSKPQERDALLRWRIKESLGFPPEQAALSYQITSAEPKSVEVLVLAVKREILAQYSAAIEAIGGATILILPVTLALLPLLAEDEPGGQLLVHIHSGWITTAVVTGGRLRFWRSRPLERSGRDSGISEAASEAARAAASVRDRMKIEIQRAWYCARPGTGDGLAAALGEIAGHPANPLPLGRATGASLTPEEKPLFEAFGAPIAGLIANAGGIQ
jgi:hypothetical protein